MTSQAVALDIKLLSRDANARIVDLIAEQQVQVHVTLHHVRSANTQSPIHRPVIPIARRGPPRKGTARVRSERQKKLVRQDITMLALG